MDLCSGTSSCLQQSTAWAAEGWVLVNVVHIYMHFCKIAILSGTSKIIV